MKLFIQILAILIGGYILATFLPWYSIAFAALVGGYYLHSGMNFLGGFLGASLLWGLKIFLITSASSNDLGERVARIFPVKEEVWLILVSMVIAGLVGGMAAVTGGLMRGRKYAGVR